jgi:hypothetical protein
VKGKIVDINVPFDVKDILLNRRDSATDHSCEAKVYERFPKFGKEDCPGTKILDVYQAVHLINIERDILFWPYEE